MRSRPDPSLLPWWHPFALMRGAWNLAFSLACGWAAGALTADLLPQLLAALSRQERGLFEPLAQGVGLLAGGFVAFVLFMTYRLDEKS